MRVLQIPAIPLDRMWGHGPVPPLEGALELLHEQAAKYGADLMTTHGVGSAGIGDLGTGKGSPEWVSVEA